MQQSIIFAAILPHKGQKAVFHLLLVFCVACKIFFEEGFLAFNSFGYYKWVGKKYDKGVE